MELKKVQKQPRDERTQEDYPTSVVYFCRCRVVFLRSFISALFLYFFQLHPYLKSSFKETFFPSWCITGDENQCYVKQTFSILFLFFTIFTKMFLCAPISPGPSSLPDYSYNTLVHPSTLSCDLLLCSLLLHQIEMTSIDSYCAVVYCGEWFFLLVAVEVFGWLHSFLTLAHFELLTTFTKSMLNSMQF